MEKACRQEVLTAEIRALRLGVGRPIRRFAAGPMICLTSLRAKAKIKNSGVAIFGSDDAVRGSSGGIFLLSHPLLDFF